MHHKFYSVTTNGTNYLHRNVKYITNNEHERKIHSKLTYT